jgi:hypothetical protein
LNVAIDFFIQLTAGLVGVFTGVILALWRERRRKARQDADEQAQRAQELAETRRLIMTSVVKNTSEAKRLRALLGNDDDPYLFQASFELAVWEALQSYFMKLASLDERVLLTRFFDQVRRLQRLIEFHRRIRADIEVRATSLDTGDRKLLSDITDRLRTVAEDVRLEGIVLVSDYGEALHHRLLGLKKPAPPVVAA